MTTYEHLCGACNFEWDQVYGMTEDPPTLCPECNVDGQVKRLISGGSGRGIVRLTGHELKAHNRAEGKKIARMAMKDENLRANLIGEEKFHNQLLEESSITNELINIGKNAPSKKQQKEINKVKKKGSFKRVGKSGNKK